MAITKDFMAARDFGPWYDWPIGMVESQFDENDRDDENRTINHKQLLQRAKIARFFMAFFTIPQSQIPRDDKWCH